MAQLLTTILWWAAVLTAWFLASAKGRNRYGWTITVALVPILWLILLVLPYRHEPEPGPVETF